METPGAGATVQQVTPQQTPIQQQNVQQSQGNPYEIDPNRKLEPMTDPIAYRKSYDESNIIKQ